VSVHYGKGAKGKATRLHSLVVRSRGRCEACGDADYQKLQCAHVVSRKYNATRVDPDAALCLCWVCHRRFTDWPVEWATFLNGYLGAEKYEAIRARAEAGVKVSEAFWLERCLELQLLLNEQEGAA
jgi:hypothetical protein